MKKRKPNWSRIIPCCLGLIAVACILAIVIKLVIWNKGQQVVITDEDLASITLDTSDNILLLPPSLFRPDTDDGVPTIAVFGNDSYYEGLGDSTSITDYVKEEIPEAVIYNFCLPNSRLTAYNADELSPEECPEDYFTFFWLTLSKKFDRMSTQETALNYLDPSKYDIDRYRQVISELDALDMESVDLILICYDGHDYLDAVYPISSEDDSHGSSNVATIVGSITSSIYVLMDGFPDIQYIYLSPVFCYAKDENGKNADCDKYNTGNGTIADYIHAAKTACELAGSSYMDLFTGVAINEETADEYLNSDGITPNKEARRLIAARISKLLSDRLIPSKN